MGFFPPLSSIRYGSLSYDSQKAIALHRSCRLARRSFPPYCARSPQSIHNAPIRHPHTKHCYCPTARPPGFPAASATPDSHRLKLDGSRKGLARRLAFSAQPQLLLLGRDCGQTSIKHSINSSRIEQHARSPKLFCCSTSNCIHPLTAARIWNCVVYTCT